MNPELIGILMDLGAPGIMAFLYFQERGDRKAAEQSLQAQSEKTTALFRELFEKAQEK